MRQRRRIRQKVWRKQAKFRDLSEGGRRTGEGKGENGQRDRRLKG